MQPNLSKYSLVTAEVPPGFQGYIIYIRTHAHAHTHRHYIISNIYTENINGAV